MWSQFRFLNLFLAEQRCVVNVLVVPVEYLRHHSMLPIVFVVRRTSTTKLSTLIVVEEPPAYEPLYPRTLGEAMSIARSSDQMRELSRPVRWRAVQLLLGDAIETISELQLTLEESRTRDGGVSSPDVDQGSSPGSDGRGSDRGEDFDFEGNLNL